MVRVAPRNEGHLYVYVYTLPAGFATDTTSIILENFALRRRSQRLRLSVLSCNNIDAQSHALVTPCFSFEKMCSGARVAGTGGACVPGALQGVETTLQRWGATTSK